MKPLPDYGALVISLDFEIHWGVRHNPDDAGTYRRRLLAERQAIPRLLDAFAEYGVAATWATVGFLFAASRRELEEFSPAVVPRYEDTRLFPYTENIGDGEGDDPLHYAPSLIRMIRERARQEIGTHTYSHYFCLERGQTRETFRADLRSAKAIAAKYGVSLRSIVFPRNQFNPDYNDILKEEGIVALRGSESAWMYKPEITRDDGRLKRVTRALDAYCNLSGANLVGWDRVRMPDGMCNIPSSRFLRHWRRGLRRFEPLRLARITAGIRRAAASRQIFHLWAHPHNFGADMDENFAFLRQVLEVFKECRDRQGLRSLSMGEVADSVLGASGGH
jgi:peptidoglycan/xylan/chitin deacetylase (PgdA/CDA1 family)